MTGDPTVPPSPQQERLQHLLDRHFDQALSNEERADLQQLLLSSAAARDAFWTAAQWHASLRQWGESEWGRMPVPPSETAPTFPPSRGSRKWDSLRTTLVAAAALLLIAAVWWNYPQPPGPALPGELAAMPPNQAAPLPVLTHCTETRWESPGPGRYAGERLPVGIHRLRSGLAQVEFPNGAHVVLAAPCDVDIRSDNTLRLLSGRLRAYVPETARGFVLLHGESPTRLTAGDVATELGFQVDPDGAGQLHVVQGAVHLAHPRQADAPRTPRIGSGEAVGIREGAVIPVACQPDRFPSEAMLVRKELEATARQFAAWRSAAEARARGSELVVFLDFEQPARSARLIQNRAHGAPPGEGATLVGCDWVEGRWPGKGAVEFKHESDRLLLNVPSAFNALSVVAWVRVDSLPHRLHSLLMADGPAGRINWCITDSGALSFGIQIPDDGRGWLIHRSSHPIAPEQLGSWLCLATVHQLDGTVLHFINGEPAGSGRLGERTGAKLGRCEIGNAAPPPRHSGASPTKAAFTDRNSPGEPPRNFVGRMDEFAIYGRGLSAPEIRELHALGREATPTHTP